MKNVSTASGKIQKYNRRSHHWHMGIIRENYIRYNLQFAFRYY